MITLENDSGYILDINHLFHSNGEQQISDNLSYKHYPVLLAENFIQQLKEKNITTDTSFYEDKLHEEKYITLWSGIHSTLGGGWVHFVNCLKLN